MAKFAFSFLVSAILESVKAFREDTNVHKILNPPFMPVHLHRFDPMADGSITDFILWVGPLPVRWRAVHSRIDTHGFTDIQESSPLAFWRQTHHFEIIDESRTRIHEHINYEYKPGWRGMFPRIMCSRLGLVALFKCRKWITCRLLTS